VRRVTPDDANAKCKMQKKWKIALLLMSQALPRQVVSAIPVTATFEA
jgi:hypothetical protein